MRSLGAAGASACAVGYAGLPQAAGAGETFQAGPNLPSKTLYGGDAGQGYKVSGCGVAGGRSP